MFNSYSLCQGSSCHYVKKGLLLGALLTGSYVCMKKLILRLKKKPTEEHLGFAVIFITGCDSGIGYSLAHYCHGLGFYVFAGVLDDESVGAKSLRSRKQGIGETTVIKIDVTDKNDIEECFKKLSKFLLDHPDYYLCAIINNAGIMVFGELEWQTTDMIFQQINVNLLGAINLTKTFIPLLRQSKGRIINVSSHCAMAPLPGLSVYAASKCGLQAWNDAIRIEYAKYGIKVISFVPGSFFLQSNILSNQSTYASKMKIAMTEDALQFYGDYFERYQEYIGALSGDKPPRCIRDETLYNNFNHALTSQRPLVSYSNSPLRYSFYHFLFRVTPIRIRDYLVESFVNMPKFK